MLKNALEAACATFVYDLPDGLETVLTERGGGLSEGQLQRLAVARAFVSNRPVLLFDEATSALDSETEKQLLQNVKNMQDKTCIIVTHRPAALEIADRILRVENGELHFVE
jgi:ABC-type bacteriocin/lantibiotic exporter with double-glycine peptidase domain